MRGRVSVPDQAALSGSLPKAPGSAGGYLLWPLDGLRPSRGSNRSRRGLRPFGRHCRQLTRGKDDEVAYAAVERAFVAGLTTAPRRAQASEERYQAAREAAGLRGEAKGLTIENATLEGELTRIGAALDQAKTAYRDGAILAPCDGTIGPIVAAPGTVLNPGQQVAEVFHGNRYVVAYLPTNRIYSLRSGDDVVVTDGTSRQPGRIDRIAELADAIPREFQSNFGTIERQQVRYASRWMTSPRFLCFQKSK